MMKTNRHVVPVLAGSPTRLVLSLLLGALLGALFGVPMAAQAQTQGGAAGGAPSPHDLPDAQARSLPMSLALRFDAVHLPDHERLGLLSTALLFEAERGWWAGPVLVGAAAGQRGGFFVLGAQVEHRWQLSGPWRAQLGMMAGGGGGGNAPVGGGLMLQPSASLLHDWGAVQAGVSWSHVGFPSGRISSQQWGLLLNWDGRLGYFAASDIGRPAAGPERSGFGIDRLVLDTSLVRIRPGAAAPASAMRLVGVRAEHVAGAHATWGLEAAAAAHGGADGYMEVLATGGWETPLSALGLNSVSVGARAALGLGGGGSQQTGGGSVGKAAALARWDMGQGAFVGLEAGEVRSGSGGFRGRYTQWQAGLQLDHPGAPGPAAVWGLEWAASLQHHAHVARRDGTERGLETMGMKFKHGLGEQFYLTGQAQMAVAGGAGAYGIGLAGLGWSTGMPTSAWRLSAELLGGAAGGGGVSTQGGAVAQGMLLVARQWRDGSALQLGAGQLRSQNGGLNTPVLDISWSQRFGVARR